MGTSLNGLTPAGTYPGLIKTGDNAPIDGTLKTLSDGNGNNLPMAVSTTAVNFTNQLQQGGVAVPTASQVNAKQDTLVSGTNIKTINGTSLLGSGNIPVVTNPSGVAGAIQFSNGSAFASDAANLFWDDTNNRLGIGTNAPTSNLQVLAPNNSVIAKFSTAQDGFVIMDRTSGGTAAAGIYGANVTPSDTNFILLNVVNAYTRLNGQYVDLSNAGQVGFRLDGGKVGIGELAATARLQVKGSGSTSATTSLLVQNSSGVTGLTVFDNGNVSVGGSANSGYQLFGNGNWFNNGSIYSPQYYFVNIAPSAGGSTNFYGNVNNFKIGTTATATASAVFEVDSTTKGFLPPRMTTTQKNAIASPAAGLMVYDSTTNKLQCYNGSTWNDLF